MAKNSVNSLFLFFALGLAPWIVACHHLKNPLPMDLSIDFSQDGLKVESMEIVATKSSPSTKQVVKFQGNDAKLKIVRTSHMVEEEAHARAKDRIFFVTSLYRNQVSPYPDRLSKVISCEKLPDVHSHDIPGGWLKRIRLRANDRSTFGNCEKSQQTQLAIVIMAYCRERQNYFDIDFFIEDPHEKSANLKRISDFESSIKCQ